MQPDGFRPRRDGTIDFDIAGYRYACRPIRLGEYFALRRDVEMLTSDAHVVAWTVSAVAVLSGWWIRQPPAWFENPELPARMIDHWRMWPIPLWEKPQPMDPRRRAHRQSKRPQGSRTWGVYAEVAPIYEGLATRGIGGDHDQFPLWKVAAMLGGHNIPDDEQGGNANDWLARGSFGRGDSLDDEKPGPVGPAARKSARATPATGSLAPLDPSEAIRLRVEAAEAGRPAPKWEDSMQGVPQDLLGNLT